jgi:hypothetical protein
MSTPHEGADASVTPWSDTVLMQPATAAPAARSARLPATLRHLRTGRGNVLVAGATQIEMGDAASPDALFALFPDDNRQLVFLLAPDLRKLAMRGDGMVGPAISAFRLQTDNQAVIRLRHPLSPQRFVGVTQPGAGGANGCVIFDSLGTGPLDRFELVGVDPAGVPEVVIELATELCGAVAYPLRAATVLDRLRGRMVRPELAGALLRVLPREELADLARALLENPDDLVLLRQCMPDNPWFARVLPELSAWHARRHHMQGGVLHSPAADEFAGDPFEGFGQQQVGLALTALARATIRPTRGACLLTTVRNEGVYFLEWLASHRSIGFEHAFIYTNDNTDASGPLLESLGANGVITLVRNAVGARGRPQNKMHGHALSLLPAILDYRWAAIIDADEFIGFDKRRYRDFTDVMAWHETQPIDALALCWVMFAAGAADGWRDELTLKRFTRREPHANMHVKTVFRPAKFCNARVHCPHASLGMPFVYRTETGALHHAPGMADRDPAFAASPSADLAWVNHYWLRSAPELLWKLARGHPDWKGPSAARHLEMARSLCGSFVKFAGRGDMVDDRRILACAEGAAAELAALRGLPGVAAGEARTRVAFRELLPRMVQAFMGAARNEPAEFAAFRDILRKEAVLV